MKHTCFLIQFSSNCQILVEHAGYLVSLCLFLLFSTGIVMTPTFGDLDSDEKVVGGMTAKEVMNLPSF